MTNGKYRVLDLFSGCGGFSVGFIQAGFEIVVANDIWKPAGETYQLNHPSVKFALGDITQNVVKDEIESLFGEGKLRCNVVIGGPPCQAYSLAGLRNPDDPRGKLFEDYVKLVRRLAPDIFVMENVLGILSMRHNKELVTDLILNRFRDAGYKVEFRPLDAADYGVPQHRVRVIFIGTKHDIPILFPDQTHCDGGSFDGVMRPYVTVKEAIGDIIGRPENHEWNHLFTKHSKEFIDKIKATPVGKNVTKYSESFFRAPPNKPSKTAKGNHGSVFIHYAEDRSMTAREFARLQSFPDDFIFKGTKHDQFVMLGNAVPCGLARAIAGAVKDMLNNIGEQHA